MEYIGSAITTNIISALVGKQIMTQAISDASGSIYSNISSIFNYNLQIDDTLNLLDIKEKIKVIESLVNNMNISNMIIDRCITSIHDVILLIREDLKLLKLLIEEHKEKYFSKWRRLNYKNNLKDLKIHSNILNTRFDNLLKTIEILNYINLKSEDKLKLENNLKIKRE